MHIRRTGKAEFARPMTGDDVRGLCAAARMAGERGG
jgi:hypothetical protein